MKEYYAKTSRSGSPDTVREHLSKVSRLAEEYGAVFSQGIQAKLGGLLHDFGKYADNFQDVLKGTRTGIDHAICGAVFLRSPSYFQVIAEVVAAHHSRLLCFGSLEPVLRESITSTKPTITDCGKEAALSGKAEYTAAWKRFLKDFPDFQPPAKTDFLPEDLKTSPIARMLYARMLLSCLADADYTVSADDPPEDGAPIDAATCLQRLRTFQQELACNSTSDRQLNQLRNELFTQCGQAAEQPGGLFTLTAPTGTGKTLALLNFALNHYLYTRKRRIIVVLPYLSLIEQSAAVYANIIPDILEDHSQRELPDELREHAARWDQPFILTTSVRFFESLFADRPTDCRKLHNIANSVILFDEAQSLPLCLTGATLQAVNELCSRYNCTMVFSTATQPAFDELQNITWQPREILPDHARYYDSLRRTQVRWELEQRLPLAQVAKDMTTSQNVCTIVNLRRHARTLYRELTAICPPEAVFLISTDLCPAHRTQIIAEIRERQQLHKPCYVVSTQCIEAGVDLDFDRMFRALAPLEAITQAAGRCNRNGHSPMADVTVFVPDEPGRLYPDDDYANAAEIVRNMLAAGPVDIHDPACVFEYYQRRFQLYRGDSRSRELGAAISDHDYQKVAETYHLIPDRGIRVIVPYTPMLDAYQAISQAVAAGPVPAKLLREAAPITVTVFSEAQLAGICEPVYLTGRGGVRMPSGVYILCAGQGQRYDGRMGLSFEQNTSLIF